METKRNKRDIKNVSQESTDNEEIVSKTTLKKQMHALQALGEKLADLKPEKWQSLTLSDSLMDALEQAKKMKSGNARRRQIQYIGKLMRKEDDEVIDAIRKVL